MPDTFLVDGLEAFEKSLTTFLQVAQRDTSNHIKDLAYRITYNLVMETPQYSGAAASAWRVGLGTPDYITEKPHFQLAQELDSRGFKVDVNPFSKRRRNMEAVNSALAAAASAVSAYTLPLTAGGMPVYIVNGLPYTQWFEAGQSGPSRALRMVNQPHRKVAAVVRESLLPTNILRF